MEWSNLQKMSVQLEKLLHSLIQTRKRQKKFVTQLPNPYEQKICDKSATENGRIIFKFANFSANHGLPHSGVAYFFIPQTYDTKVAEELLAEHGVSCPTFTDYVGNLVKFVEAHPKL